MLAIKRHKVTYFKQVSCIKIHNVIQYKYRGLFLFDIYQWEMLENEFNGEMISFSVDHLLNSIGHTSHTTHTKQHLFINPLCKCGSIFRIYLIILSGNLYLILNMAMILASLFTDNSKRILFTINAIARTMTVVGLVLRCLPAQPIQFQYFHQLEVQCSV